MHIVPVIDLKDGEVVHARGGARDDYLPIHSILSDSSEPLSVVGGLLRLHPFSTLYVADLDAIEGRGGHDATLEGIGRSFPSLHLWVDNGLSESSECRSWLEKEIGDLVLGSESQGDAKLLEALGEEAPGRVILSLDFKGPNFIGPAEILAEERIWTQRVIVMTLARVGGQLGPDIDRLQSVRARAADRQIFAAGGVRGESDLVRLADLGVSGALVASVLHDGRLTRSQLHALRQSDTKPH